MLTYALLAAVRAALLAATDVLYLLLYPRSKILDLEVDHQLRHGTAEHAVRQLAPTQPSCHVSIRQHTSAYVRIRQHAVGQLAPTQPSCRNTSTYVSIRQHTSAYVSLLSAYISIRQHTSAYVSIRQTARSAAAL